jgi:hypothetical protein
VANAVEFVGGHTRFAVLSDKRDCLGGDSTSRSN